MNPITVQESNHFAEIKAVMIAKYIAEKNIDTRKLTVGVIEDRDGQYIWTTENPYDTPVCSCGNFMMRGSAVYHREDRSYEIIPYYWCDSPACTRERHARWNTGLAAYREQSGAPSDFDKSLAMMGIPEGYRGWTLGKFDNDKARTAGRSAMKAGESMYITGKPGTGKTHLAVGLLIEYGHAEPKYHRFVSVPKLIMELHGDVKQDRDYTERIADLTAVRVLVLDDLGAEKCTEYVRAVLYELVNERIMSGYQTIVTSNLELGEIATNIDERLASRLSGFHTIHLTGTDRRAARKRTA